MGYLAYETVAQIVDLAFLVRQDQNKLDGDPIDRLQSSYHNPITYKPYHSKVKKKFILSTKSLAAVVFLLIKLTYFFYLKSVTYDETFNSIGS